MTVTKYGYDERTEAEITHMARAAIPTRVVLEHAPLADDFGGVDFRYRVNHSCDLQVRCRFNRPAYASDIDVTFRATEARMIEAGTYAPLMLFLWLTNGYAKAGKLVDIYRMAERIDPPLGERRKNPNGDGTHWIAVEIPELVAAGALLRQGDRDEWAPAALGGNDRVQWILDHSWAT